MELMWTIYFTNVGFKFRFFNEQPSLWDEFNEKNAHTPHSIINGCMAEKYVHFKQNEPNICVSLLQQVFFFFFFCKSVQYLCGCATLCALSCIEF